MEYHLVDLDVQQSTTQQWSSLASLEPGLAPNGPELVSEPQARARWAGPGKRLGRPGLVYLVRTTVDDESRAQEQPRNRLPYFHIQSLSATKFSTLTHFQVTVKPIIKRTPWDVSKSLVVAILAISKADPRVYGILISS
jgi:hypothetical protein